MYVDIDPDTYEGIKELVADGRYESVEQFLRVAADNQLSVERSKDVDTDYSRASTPPSTRAAATAPAEAGDSAADGSTEVTTTRYEWEYDPPASPPTRQPASANRAEMLLFSQYYRFMPLKFALVELAQATADAGAPIALEEFRDHMREAVVPMRDALVAWEAEADVKKQDRFSTGFPKRDSKNPERSMKRYLNHYVGHFRTEAEEAEGLGHQLGFVSIQPDDGEVTIALSPAGALFLTLENSLLAKGPSRERSTLSDEEQNHLVSHVRRTLPLEYDFMDYVYEILDHHEGTYTNHMDRFRVFLDQAPGFTDDPDENRVRSHTAGTISRMVDLGLLKRGNRRGEYEPVRPPEAFRYPDQLRDEVQARVPDNNQTDTKS